MLINNGILSSSCTPGIWKENVGPNVAKSFPIVFQILLIVLKKRYIGNSMKEHKKSGDPLFFKLKIKWQHRSKPLALHFWENLQSDSDILKLMWLFPRYGFEPGSSKIWTLQFRFYHIFSNPRTSRAQTRFQFHVHTTHSPMLKIMWVQNFKTN
jgi:hypothetical protein